MAKKRLWFGNEQHAQWVPSPKTGMTHSFENFYEEMALDNGGHWDDRSAASHSVYNLDFPVSYASELEGIEAFPRFASGEYGFDYIRFIDIMRADENLFNQNWAAPGLSIKDWVPIYDTTPTFVATGANVYGKPFTKAVFNLSGVANAVPTKPNSVFTLLIPPTHKIAIGASYQSTGTGVIRIQPVNLDGTLAAVVNLATSTDASAPTLSATFSGATYRSVRIYLTQTSAGAATATVSALWAQCVPIAQTPVISRHIPGKGHSGLGFSGGAFVESYVAVNRFGKRVGASITLKEKQPWAP